MCQAEAAYVPGPIKTLGAESPTSSPGGQHLTCAITLVLGRKHIPRNSTGKGYKAKSAKAKGAWGEGENRREL